MHRSNAITRRASLVAALALLGSGCFGSFGATHSLYKWNSEVSDSKWLRWLVFLALAILPVYSLFVLADVLVLNTIEFFSGKNPIGEGHADLGDGNTLTSTRTADPNLIRHEHRHNGKLVRVLYVRRVSAREMIVLDAKMRPLTRVRLDAHGAVEVHDGQGRQLSMLTPAEVDRASAAVQGGASAVQAVAAELQAQAGIAPSWPA